MEKALLQIKRLCISVIFVNIYRRTAKYQYLPIFNCDKLLNTIWEFLSSENFTNTTHSRQHNAGILAAVKVNTLVTFSRQ